MPDLENIEKFNQDLIKLGNEPAIAKQRGEAIEPVMTPEEYPMDHGGVGPRTNRSLDPAEEPPESAGSSTDDFLSELDPDLFSGSAATPPAANETDALFGEDAPIDAASPPSDFDDLFDDDIFSSIPQTPEQLDEPEEFDEPETIDEPALPEPEDTPIEPDVPTELDSPSEEDFGIPDLGDLDFSASDSDEPDTEMPADPEAESEAATDPDFPPQDSTEDDPFGDIDFGEGDLDAGAIDEISAPDEPAAPISDDLDDLPSSAEELPEESSFDTDFGNFDFGDEARATTSDSGIVTPSDEPDESSATPDFGAGDIPDFATDLSTDFGTDDFADEFNMGDFGKDFGVMEEFGAEGEKAVEEDRQHVMEEVDEVIAKASAADEAEAFELSSADFDHIQQSLAAMPLNLKIATEEALANTQYSFDAIHPLLNSLIRGESPKDIAVLVSRVTGKKIKVPAGYERKTGLAFEQEQRSFAYQFRENILPLLRVIGLTAVALVVLAVAAYQWVYRPLYGNSLYDRGIAAIRAEEYEQGNKFFRDAYQIWPDNNRYLEYARAFRDMRQWSQARTKYEELLGMPDVHEKPFGKDRMHRQGILDFADFAAYTLRDYNSAANYLQRLIDVDKFDKEAGIAQGDVFMEWARYTGALDVVEADRTVSRTLLASFPEKEATEAEVLTGPLGLYSAARYNYAALMSKFGQTDELLSRMLRYFMRLGQFTEDQAQVALAAADKARGIGDFETERQQTLQLKTLDKRRQTLEGEVEKIKKVFLDDPKAKPDPVVIAELAGVIIDRAEGKLHNMEDALTLSVKALKSSPEAMHEPSLHYQLARYYRYLRNKEKETEALSWARTYFEEREKDRPLDRFELSQRIDTLIRNGEVLYGPLYKGTEVVKAQLAFEEARDQYEQGLRTRMIRDRSSLFGRVYARLGDIKYYEAADYEGALRQYRLARQSQYGVPPDEQNLNLPRLSLDELSQASQDVSYKMGFIWSTLANRLPEGSMDKALMYDQAAREFLQVQGSLPLENDNLDLAIATTNYLRGNFDAAASSYRLLAERIENERLRTTSVIAEEDTRQRELVELLIRIDNNLGVSLYRLGRQGGRYADQELAQGRFNVSRATELYQAISHNPLTPGQPSAESDRLLAPTHFGLAFTNLQAMVLPGREGQVEIFRELRKDLTSTDFSEKITAGGPGL